MWATPQSERADCANKLSVSVHDARVNHCSYHFKSPNWVHAGSILSKVPALLQHLVEEEEADSDRSGYYHTLNISAGSHANNHNKASETRPYEPLPPFREVKDISKEEMRPWVMAIPINVKCLVNKWQESRPHHFLGWIESTGPTSDPMIL